MSISILESEECQMYVSVHRPAVLTPPPPYMEPRDKLRRLKVLLLREIPKFS